MQDDPPITGTEVEKDFLVPDAEDVDEIIIPDIRWVLIVEKEASCSDSGIQHLLASNQYDRLSFTD